MDRQKGVYHCVRGYDNRLSDYLLARSDLSSPYAFCGGATMNISEILVKPVSVAYLRLNVTECPICPTPMGLYYLGLLHATILLMIAWVILLIYAKVRG